MILVSFNFSRRLAREKNSAHRAIYFIPSQEDTSPHQKLIQIVTMDSLKLIPTPTLSPREVEVQILTSKGQAPTNTKRAFPQPILLFQPNFSGKVSLELGHEVYKEFCIRVPISEIMAPSQTQWPIH